LTCLFIYLTRTQEVDPPLSPNPTPRDDRTQSLPYRQRRMPHHSVYRSMPNFSGLGGGGLEIGMSEVFEPVY
jgi:hypothetical protein